MTNPKLAGIISVLTEIKRVPMLSNSFYFTGIIFSLAYDSTRKLGDGTNIQVFPDLLLFSTTVTCRLMHIIHRATAHIQPETAVPVFRNKSISSIKEQQHQHCYHETTEEANSDLRQVMFAKIKTCTAEQSCKKYGYT